jgi:hypothetical protein
MAGIPMKFTTHEGLNHGKLTLLWGQGMSIFGSSNWTVPSANSQHEENYFTRNASLFNWFVSYFNRRWNNTAPGGIKETGAFTPLPPSTPSYNAPANGAIGVATSGAKLKWWAGLWPYYYDIYFGTTTQPPLFASNVNLGNSLNHTDYKAFTLPTLQPGTTYYWQIVSKTAAMQPKAGPIWSFRTAGSGPGPTGGNDIVLWASTVTNIHGNWVRLSDPNTGGGVALRNPDAGQAKIAPALASPANYFEIAFNAASGVAYHVWVRLRAYGNSLGNDSIHMQFSDSLVNGGSFGRIGTSSSLEMVLQNGPSGSAPHGWGWTDNGWGSLGPPISFANSGTHVLRIQQREDGSTVDQIVLSPGNYFSSPPGSRIDDTTVLQRTQ